MPTDRAIHISKSKYLAGLQCPKLLWTWYNQRDLIPEPGAAQQHIFDTGHLVGDLAKELYPGGKEVPMLVGTKDAIELTVTATRDLIKRRVPIFEASFLVDARYCRVDILVPVPGFDGARRSGEAWDLIEVKSSTRVKDVNINDVAFQYDALTRSGVELNRLYIMHINNGYVRGDKFEVGKFFHLEDVTERAMALTSYIPAAMEKMLTVIDGPDPDTPIGPRCTRPFTCPLKEVCWADLPDDNVTELYFGGNKAFSLLDEGYFHIAETPDSRLSHQQLIQKRALIEDKLQVDRPALRAWLEGLEYPLYHLDFETMNVAVPPFKGVRPYQRIPFQFSLHIQREPGAEPEHVEFLADWSDQLARGEEPGDPRPGLLAALLDAVGDSGTVLAWNAAFEKGVLNDMAEIYPAEGARLAGIIDRMDDLIIPFRSFSVYHPAQKGSCSLKAVLPALTDLSYDGLEVADGNHAAREYARVVYQDATATERELVLAQLRTYCRLDTLAMVAILGKLEDLAD
jgi:hypothetical protein